MISESSPDRCLHINTSVTFPTQKESTQDLLPCIGDLNQKLPHIQRIGQGLQALVHAHQEFKPNPISFSGSISVELFNGHFYYIVNGNFYNSTSTSHTGTTGISALFTAQYSVGSTSN